MGKYLPNFKELEGLTRAKFIKFDSEHWHLFCPFLTPPFSPVLMNKLKMCRAGLEICKYVADRGLSLVYLCIWLNHFIAGLQGRKGWRAGRPVRSHVLGHAEISPTSQLQKAKHLSLNFKVFLQMLSKAPRSGSYTKVKKKSKWEKVSPWQIIKKVKL